MKKYVWRILFLGTGFLWVALELLSIFDGNANTEPLTVLIVENIPMVVGLPLILGFSAWLAHHFIEKYKKRQ